MTNAVNAELKKIHSLSDLGKFAQKTRKFSMIEIGNSIPNITLDILLNWPSFGFFSLIEEWNDPGMLTAIRKHSKYKDYSITRSFNEQEELFSNFEQSIVPIFGANRTFIQVDKFNKNMDGYFDESIDFIYLNKRFDYCTTQSLLEFIWPKLKCWGIISGYGYMTASKQKKLDPNQDWNYCLNGEKKDEAVKGAVDDFVLLTGTPYLGHTNDKWPSWFFLKYC